MDDIVWSATNRRLVNEAARDLYTRICPEGRLGESEILNAVQSWSFKDIDPIRVDPDVGDEETLSLVETGPRKSFVDVFERKQQLFIEGGRQFEPLEERLANPTVEPVTERYHVGFDALPDVQTARPFLCNNFFRRNEPTQLRFMTRFNGNRFDFDLI